MSDPAAASLDRSLGRLARTLQILIDGSPGQQVLTPIDARTFPDRIERSIDTLTTRR